MAVISFHSRSPVNTSIVVTRPIMCYILYYLMGAFLNSIVIRITLIHHLLPTEFINFIETENQNYSGRGASRQADDVIADRNNSRRTQQPPQQHKPDAQQDRIRQLQYDRQQQLQLQQDRVQQQQQTRQQQQRQTINNFMNDFSTSVEVARAPTQYVQPPHKYRGLFTYHTIIHTVYTMYTITHTHLCLHYDMLPIMLSLFVI